MAFANHLAANGVYDAQQPQNVASGSTYGLGQATQACKVETEHEAASRQWANAWSRLKQAEAALAQANAEANAAHNDEQAAWNALEGTDGRARDVVPNAAKPDPRRY